MQDNSDCARDAAPLPAFGAATDPAQVTFVILAASAGGLAALSTVLAALPSDFPAGIAVVLHRATRPETDPLREILQKRVTLRVELAGIGTAICPATVYIAPPDSHLRIDLAHRFATEPGPLLWHVRSAADPLLISAAAGFGAALVAVILTGKGRDGALGAAAVRRAGGTVLAQDPATSDAAGMPQAAIATGAVHSVLSLVDIAPRLVTLAARGRTVA